MQKLIDKGLLFALCLLILLLKPTSLLSLAALLLAVTLTSLCSYFENRPGIYLYGTYLLLCCFRGEFLAFLPLLVYDAAELSPLWLRFTWVLPLLIHFPSEDILFWVGLVLICMSSLLLHQRTSTFQNIRQHFYQEQDRTKERELTLQQMNRSLMEKQDYEVQLATLSERNRIAREIHDNVGHLLTRSLLQLRALQVINQGQEPMEENLSSVQATLTDAMNSIRESVHNLHDESLDLQIQITALVGEYKFCPVKLHYDMGELPKELKYTFLAIVREALSNIARHSNATSASVTLLEHPALYQLVIEDNGTASRNPSSSGIGLQNMKDRVEASQGIFRAEQKRGFKIFISIPKEREAL